MATRQQMIENAQQAQMDALEASVPIGTVKSWADYMGMKPQSAFSWARLDPSRYYETQGMTDEQFADSTYSPWKRQADGSVIYRGYQANSPLTWIDDPNDAGSTSLGGHLMNAAKYAAPVLGAGVALGGLSQFGVPGLFGSGTAAEVANPLASIGGGSSGGGLLGVGDLTVAPWEDVLAGNYFGDPAALGQGVENLTGNAMDSILGDDFLQQLTNPYGLEGGMEGVGEYLPSDPYGEGWGLSEGVEMPPQSNSFLPTESQYPNVSDDPFGTDVQNIPSGGVPPPSTPSNSDSGWIGGLAKALGMSVGSLGRIIAGLAGGGSQVVQGNRQVGASESSRQATSAAAEANRQLARDAAAANQQIAREQIALSTPSRERFEQMSQNPGAWARTYYPELDNRALLDQAANVMGRGWSTRVGNPADSPRAIRATERDLADLNFRTKQSELNRLFQMDQAEKQLQATTGGLTRTNPDAPYSSMQSSNVFSATGQRDANLYDVEGQQAANAAQIAGKATRDKGIGNALAVVLKELFPGTGQKSIEDIVSELILKHPELFKKVT